MTSFSESLLINNVVIVWVYYIIVYMSRDIDTLGLTLYNYKYDII